MSHVQKAELHIYQGEDWSMRIIFNGANPPESLADYNGYMEIRKRGNSADLYVRATTCEEDGYITEVEDEPFPTWLIRIPAEITRQIPKGTHATDFFMVPIGVGDTVCLFYGDVEVSQRSTRVEAAAESV